MGFGLGLVVLELSSQHCGAELWVDSLQVMSHMLGEKGMWLTLMFQRNGSLYLAVDRGQG